MVTPVTVSHLTKCNTHSKVRAVSAWTRGCVCRIEFNKQEVRLCGLVDLGWNRLRVRFMEVSDKYHIPCSIMFIEPSTYYSGSLRSSLNTYTYKNCVLKKEKEIVGRHQVHIVCWKTRDWGWKDRKSFIIFRARCLDCRPERFDSKERPNRSHWTRRKNSHSIRLYDVRKLPTCFTLTFSSSGELLYELIRRLARNIICLVFVSDFNIFGRRFFSSMWHCSSSSCFVAIIRWTCSISFSNMATN